MHRHCRRKVLVADQFFAGMPRRFGRRLCPIVAPPAVRGSRPSDGPLTHLRSRTMHSRCTSDMAISPRRVLRLIRHGHDRSDHHCRTLLVLESDDAKNDGDGDDVRVAKTSAGKPPTDPPVTASTGRIRRAAAAIATARYPRRTRRENLCCRVLLLRRVVPLTRVGHVDP